MTEDRKPISKLDLQNRITILESDIRYLKEQIRDHGQRFYRYGKSEAQLINRMIALEHQPDAEDASEPEDAPERDFPCCDRADGHEDTVDPKLAGKMVYTRAELMEQFREAEDVRAIWMDAPYRNEFWRTQYYTAYGKASVMAELLGIDY